MDDNRYLSLWFLIFLSMCVLMIYVWTGHFGVILVGLFAIPLLSFTLPWLMDLVSTISASLFYGTFYTNSSYENRFYQDDMDRAKRLIREKRWDEAISAYRAIIQKVPKKYEVQFNLARIYQMAGHLGLALHEYNKLRSLRDDLGSNHLFVLESERAVEELKGMVSEERWICPHNGKTLNTKREPTSAKEGKEEMDSNFGSESE